VRGLLYIARARLARSGVPIGSHSNVTCGDRMRGGCASASADARSTEHGTCRRLAMELEREEYFFFPSCSAPALGEQAHANT
jgi:hypothetical protein